MKKQVQKGFTLIELMIVVAIIGILASIALPAYQDYIARSQATEGLTLMTGLKPTITEIYADEGDFAKADSGQEGILAAASIAGKYVEKVTVTDGVAVATFNATGVSASLRSQTLTLTQNPVSGTIKWDCTTSAPAKVVPASCR